MHPKPEELSDPIISERSPLRNTDQSGSKDANNAEVPTQNLIQLDE